MYRRRWYYAAAIVLVAIAAGMAVIAYGALRNQDPSAKVTGVSCRWQRSRMYATAVLQNTSSRQGFFDLRVSYVLSEHGKQPTMTALAPVDPHSSKSFTWGDLNPYYGEPIKSCSASVHLEPDGND